MHWTCPRGAEKLFVHFFLSFIDVDHQHAKMAATIITLSAFTIGALAAAEPAVTEAAMLYPRQIFPNPALVGYISASDGCKLCPEIIKYHRSLTFR